MDYQTLLDMIPAYALNALDAEEKQAVETFLAENDSARQLLQEYQTITEGLALTAPLQTPPPALEDKLRQRIRKKRSRSSVTIHWLMALAAMMAIVMLGVLLLNTGQENDPEDLYRAIAANPQSVQLALIPVFSPDIEGDMVYQTDTMEAVIRVSNLPPLEEGQAFQLWLITETSDTSGGIFQFDDQTNYIRVSLPEPITNYARFGMTIEPETGSPLINKSSGPRVFSIPIEGISN